MRLIIYFIVGFLLDMFATLDIQAVQKDQAFKSAFVSFTGTVLSYYVFYDIIIGPDFLLGLISYALGGAVGALVTMRRNSIKSFFLKFFAPRFITLEIKKNISGNVDIQQEKVVKEMY